MSHSLESSETFNLPDFKDGECRKNIDGISSFVTCGLPMFAPFALAFSMPEHTLARIMASYIGAKTPDVCKKFSSSNDCY